MANPDDSPPFTPVPVAARRDGWTPDRQRAFIEALAVMGVVARAAKAVGMSATSAYNLRARPGAGDFAVAWDRALDCGRGRAFDVAYDRAINGYTEPRFYRGKQVGTIHRFDTRMHLAALNASWIRPPAADKPRR